jgi:hypothetical protein
VGVKGKNPCLAIACLRPVDGNPDHGAVADMQSVKTSGRKEYRVRAVAEFF